MVSQNKFEKQFLCLSESRVNVAIHILQTNNQTEVLVYDILVLETPMNTCNHLLFCTPYQNTVFTNLINNWDKEN